MRFFFFFFLRCGSTTAECRVNGPARRLMRRLRAAVNFAALCHVHLDRSLTIQNQSHDAVWSLLVIALPRKSAFFFSFFFRKRIQLDSRSDLSERN